MADTCNHDGVGVPCARCFVLKQAKEIEVLEGKLAAANKLYEHALYMEGEMRTAAYEETARADQAEQRTAEAIADWYPKAVAELLDILPAEFDPPTATAIYSLRDAMLRGDWRPAGTEGVSDG